MMINTTPVFDQNQQLVNSQVEQVDPEDASEAGADDLILQLQNEADNSQQS